MAILAIFVAGAEDVVTAGPATKNRNSLKVYVEK